jgi:hypothetical protein
MNISNDEVFDNLEVRDSFRAKSLTIKSSSSSPLGETILRSDATSSKTVRFPDLSGTVILDAGTQTITGAKTFSNVVTLSGLENVTGLISFPATAFSTAGATSVFPSNSSRKAVYTAIAVTIDGINPGADGQLLTIQSLNAGATLTLKLLSGSAVAANQIQTCTGADVVLSGFGSATLIYDATLLKWIVSSFNP